MNDPTPTAARPKRPSLLLGGAHLAALWALAFVQPMLSLLGGNPEFFVARGNTAGQIIIYVFALTLVPPLVGLGLEALARLVSRNAQWGLHLGLMTLTGAALLLQLLKDRLTWPAGILIAISLIAATAGVYAYSRWRFPRSFMDILTIAPVLVLIVFFFFSSSSRLILPREQPKPVKVNINKPAPVVMVILDELPVASLETPDGKIDASRFPAFAEVANHSTWYRNATGAAAYTPLAVPAIMSGRDPSHSDLPIAADYPHSIFTLLGDSYRMNVMESATRICPATLCPNEPEIPKGSLGDLFGDLWIVSRLLLLPDSLTRNLPDVTQTFSDFGDAGSGSNTGSGSLDTGVVPEPTPPDGPGSANGTGTGTFGEPGSGITPRTGQGSARRIGRLFAASSNVDEFDRVNRFDRNLKRGQERTLDLIHIEKPHYPWRHIPDGQRYSNLASEWGGLLPNDGEWETLLPVTNIALQRHLLETGYTDTLLARIIGRLKETGLWDRAMIIVTADHGAAFIPRVQRRTAVKRNLGQVAPVPLFIKSPGQTEPDEVFRHTCATEILPIIAAELGIEYPWSRPECAEDRVRMLNSPAGQAAGSLRRVVIQRRMLIDRIAELFGSGDGWQPVYQFGEYRRQLMNRKVKSLRVDDSTPLPGSERAQPERRNLVKVYDPAAPTLHGLLQRGLVRRIGQNQTLAIAVNGVIRALGTTFKDGISDVPGYSILLPPDAMKAGFNRVDIYLVQQDGRRLKLIYDGSEPLPGQPRQDGG